MSEIWFEKSRRFQPAGNTNISLRNGSRRGIKSVYKIFESFDEQYLYKFDYKKYGYKGLVISASNSECQIELSAVFGKLFIHN